jgi:hypothetical protein
MNLCKRFAMPVHLSNLNIKIQRLSYQQYRVWLDYGWAD